MIYKDEPKDANLLVIVAVEGYAQRHNMSEKEVFALMQKYEINSMLRSAWDVLHTQAIEESIDYVEDVLAWKQK
ncbi:MAG: hypothetical protein Ta2B_17870 [Termitinemataceae bacterium]|nr:MAG: hypothetical protein Ta2B_17870 [Termitinemataceae bacterium]